MKLTTVQILVVASLVLVVVTLFFFRSGPGAEKEGFIPPPKGQRASAASYELLPQADPGNPGFGMGEQAVGSVRMSGIY